MHKFFSLLCIASAIFSFFLEAAEQRKARKVFIPHIHRACITANMHKVDTILTSKTASKKSHDGKTPLHMVCMDSDKIDNRIIITKKLIEHGCRPDDQDKFGITPLHIACSKGIIPLVATLVSVYKPLSLSIREKLYNQPLQNALAANIPLMAKYTIAEILLNAAQQKGELIADIANIDDSIPLQQGLEILKNHPVAPEILKYSFINLLLQHTSPTALNWQNKQGKTSLHTLLDAAHDRTLTLRSISCFAYNMIQKGTNTTIHDYNGYLPITYLPYVPGYCLDDFYHIDQIHTMLRCALMLQLPNH